MNYEEGEARLSQMDVLIAEARDAERKEAARKAEEERQRAEREATRSGYTLEQLGAAPGRAGCGDCLAADALQDQR